MKGIRPVENLASKIPKGSSSDDHWEPGLSLRLTAIFR